MNELSTQFKKSGLIAIFYAAIPLIPAVIGLAVSSKTICSELSYAQVLFISIAIIYLFYFIVFFLIQGFRGSVRTFRDAEVPKKEKKMFRSLDKLSKIDKQEKNDEK